MKTTILCIYLLFFFLKLPTPACDAREEGEKRKRWRCDTRRVVEQSRRRKTKRQSEQRHLSLYTNLRRLLQRSRKTLAIYVFLTFAYLWIYLKQSNLPSIDTFLKVYWKVNQMILTSYSAHNTKKHSRK